MIKVFAAAAAAVVLLTGPALAQVGIPPIIYPCGAESNEGGKNSVRCEFDSFGITEIGRFTVTGTGAMADFDSLPWSFYKNNIRNVIVMNGVTSIGRFAFDNHVNLTSVTIPNSVTSIKSFAFRGTGLTSVTIPNSVTSIDTAAFFNCKGLTSITIPNSITRIKQVSFSQCINLTSITIPNSVNYIEPGAFTSCSSLTSIVIPESVDTVATSAFQNCAALKSVTSLNPAPPKLFAQAGAFVGLPSDACLYVPQESIAAYAAGTVDVLTGDWKHFNSIEPLQGQFLKPAARAAQSRNAAFRASVRNNILTVKLPPESVSRVRLIDMRGKSAANFVSRGNTNFPLANIPAGRYFVEARNGVKRDRVSVTVGGK